MATLAGLGDIVWHALPPLSVRNFPETADRASQALEAAIRPPRNATERFLKRKLFEWQYNGSRRLFERNRQDVAVAWNGLNGSRRVFMHAAEDAGARTIFFELAPFPDMVTVDPVGVNYANHLPRRIEPYLEWLRQSDIKPDIWRTRGRKIRQRPALVDKRDGAADLPPQTDPFVFVPLQVPGDSQIRLFGRAFRTVPDFIQALGRLSDLLPPGWHLRLKEHPSARQSFAGDLHDFPGKRIYLDNRSDTFDLVRASRAVLTVNSSVGLEAMFFDKPVIAAGDCYWAIEGVAYDAVDEVLLGRLLSSADRLQFDQGSRDAFLSYLSEVYYVGLEKRESGYFCPPDQAAKVARRIEAARGQLDSQ
jgi:capsular polysaccharide export protein